MTRLLCSGLALWLWAALGWAQSGEVVLAAGALRLPAVVYEPAGTGPFPAVVMLHGCSGMRTRAGEVGAIYHAWAARLVQAGYLGLVLDSFGGRGIEEVCTQQHRTLSAAEDRASDAYVALDWLLAQEQVDRRRVFLLGWSNGGVAVLGAMDARAAVGAGRESGFRAALAMYPGCRGFVRGGGYHPRAPLLIQIGAADDWTPAERCRELLASVPVGSPKVEVVVYPGAQHAFDRPGSKAVFRAEVWNAGRGSRGATIGGHPEAREAAVERGLEFFTQF